MRLLAGPAATEIAVAAWFLALWPEAARGGVGGSPFYEFKVVARLGNSIESTEGNFPLSNIWSFVSINDWGRVAFPGEVQLPTNADPAVVAEKPTGGGLHLLDYTDFRPAPTFLGDFIEVQINNDNWVIADRRSGGSYAELYSADQTGGQDATNGIFFPPLWLTHNVCNWLQTSPARAEDGSVAYSYHHCYGLSQYTNYLVVHRLGASMDGEILRELPEQPFYGNPPAVANGGVVVLTEGLETNGVVLRIAPGVRTNTLAATDEGWLRLPWAPAITTDGKFVVFAGQDPSTNQGVYLRVFDTNAAALATHRIIDTNTTIAFDDAGDPIRFTSFEDHFALPLRPQWPSRVCILRHDIGSDTNVIGDSLIIAFIATPSSASRTNPAARPKPLLFSGQKGIWTMRIDVQRELTGASNVVLNPHGVLPVIQVGDTIDGATITDLHLWDALGAAIAAPDGGPRLTLGGVPTPGDHYLAFWADTTIGPMVIKAAKLDTDDDGLMDHWERPGGGIDMDRDGVVDLDLDRWGASMFHKDLFLEIDWVSDRTSGYIRPWKNAPSPDSVLFLADLFFFARVLNPDATMGINLHVDAGPGNYPVFGFPPYSYDTGAGVLQGGDRIGEQGSGRHLDLVYFGLPGSFALTGVVARSFHEIKDVFFGTADKRARELAFRYCVMADFRDVARDGSGNPITNAVQSASRVTLTPVTPLPQVGKALLITEGRGAGQIRGIDDSLSTTNTLRLLKPWSVLPDASSKFVLLNTSGGLAEAYMRTAANNHSLSGNDLIVSLGGWGVDPEGYLANLEIHWRTLAHELGHTMGLRHGGNDHCEYKGSNYLSLMSYSHSVRLSLTNDLVNTCLPPFDTNFNFPVIDSFAGGTDPTFDDWSYVQMANHHWLPKVGNTFGLNSGVEVPETFTPGDFERLFGPVDLQAPLITVLAPPPRATLVLGAELAVSLDIRDESPIKRVRVRFDVNGNGTSTDPGESMLATNVSGSQFSATFPPASGPGGARSVDVEASDITGNAGVLSFNVWVGSGSPSDVSPPTLFFQQPAPNARVILESWLIVEISATDFDSAVSQVRVAFDVDGDGSTNGPGEVLPASEISPGVYQTVFRDVTGPAGTRTVSAWAIDQWLNIATAIRNVTVTTLDINLPDIAFVTPSEDETVGLSFPLTVRTTVTDDVGVNQVTIAFDQNGDGVIAASERRVASMVGGDEYQTTFGDPSLGTGVSGPEGPRVITVTAEDLDGNSGAATRTVRVTDLTGPSVLFSQPEAGAAIGLGTTVQVNLQVTDDQAVETVTVSFDINGDGSTAGPGETVTASALGGGNYQASFAGLSGPEGPRVITVIARDPSMKSTTITRTVNVASGGAFHEPLDGQRVTPSSTFQVVFEVASGVTASNVTIRFDVNGDGLLGGPGESVSPTPSDDGRRLAATFANVQGPPGARAVTVEFTDTATTTHTNTRNVVVGSFGGYPGAFSQKLAAVPFLPERLASGGVAASGPANFVAAGGYLFFTANDGVAGDELWRTDGTPGGTLLLKDVNPDIGSSPLGSGVQSLTAFNGRVYFAAQDWHGSSFGFQAPHFGNELWTSDGTPLGTVMLKDIRPGGSDGSPAELVVFNGRLFFAANDGVTGRELWTSDGTGAGTRLFLEIRSGSTGSDPKNLVVASTRLFFSANLYEIWSSDGTVPGTVRVADLNLLTGTFNEPSQFAAVGDRLFFTYSDGTNGTELWTSDGTAPGTLLLGDIEPGVAGSFPAELTAWNGRLYFTASNRFLGRELWISDGTPVGTFLLRDIWPGNTSSDPAELTAFNGALCFTAHDGANGRELWRTDGTTNGTRRAVNIAPYAGPPPASGRLYPSRSSSPRHLTVFNGALYFSADDGNGVFGRELWQSDGTPEGTIMVRDVATGFTRPLASDPAYTEPEHSDPRELFVFNGQLFFSAQDRYQRELWTSDGTTTGTRRLRNIRHRSGTPLVMRGNELYHQGADGLHGIELWRTAANGTAMFQDFYPGASNATPSAFHLFQSNLLFHVTEGRSAFAITGALWRTDGTLPGTVRLQSLTNVDSGLFGGFTELGGERLFSGADASAGAELWKTDGTPAGTARVKDIRSGPAGSSPAYPVVLGSQLLFQANDGVNNRELWTSDGTSAGTVLLTNINPGFGDANPGKFTPLNGEVLFVANDGARGYELWKTDGTPGGTRLLKDIRPGAGSSMDGTGANYAEPFTRFKDRLWFAANNGVNGRELWMTDGTSNGTVMVKDIYDSPTSNDGRPERFTIVGDTLFFAANSAVSVELWKTDGSTAGTKLVKNIRGRHPSGGYEQPSDPQNLITLNGVLLFTATDVDREDGVPARGTGREWWRSDGSDIGSIRLRDLFPGPRSPFIEWVTPVNDRVYFVADDGEHGRELWMSDGTFDGTVLVEDLLPGPASSNPSFLTNLNGVLHYFADDGGEDLSLRKLEPGIAPRSPYQAWLDAVSSLTGADRQLGADPDGDGLSNAVEYDLGSAPDDARSSGPAILSVSVLTEGVWNYVDLTYLRRRNAAERNLRYWVESSRDLTNWHFTFTLSETATPVNAAFDSVTVRVRVAASDGLQFFRLGIGAAP